MGKKINAPGSKFHGQEIEDIPKGDLDEMTPEHKAALIRQRQRQEFVGVAEEFAQSKLFFRNYKYDKLHKIYTGQLDYDKRLVDKCYPYAKGGMLLVDEPRNKRLLAICQEKQPRLKAAGFRYVIVEDFVENLNRQTSLYDLALQLGET